MNHFFSPSKWAASLFVVALFGVGTGWADVLPNTPAPLRIVRTNHSQSTEVYKPGARVGWSFVLQNPSHDPLEAVRIDWVIRSWRGQVAQGTKSVTLPPGETAVSIDYTPQQLGWFELSAQVIGPDKKVIESGPQTFAVCEAGKSDGQHFHFGVSTHTAFRKGTDFDMELELLRQLGVDMIRDEPCAWSAVEKAENVWTFERSDAYLDALEKSGIGLDSALDYTVRWASTGPQDSAIRSDWENVAPRMEPFLHYVQTCVNRYKGRIRYWEIWNEPDIDMFWKSSTESYVELFNGASQVISKTDPQAIVLNGGFAMSTGRPHRVVLNFIEKFTSQADKSHWNLWAHHDYESFNDLVTKYPLAKQIYDQNGMKIPIWINEGGFHTMRTEGERDQAITLVKKLTTAPSLGAGAYFWYDLRDDGLDPKEKEHHFGLVHNNFQPKPSYAVYKNLIHELGRARYVRSLPADHLPSGVWAHLFQSDSKDAKPAESILVAWREGNAQPTQVSIEGGSVSGVTDIMGNPVAHTPLPTGTVTSLSSEPIYIHYRGAAPNLKLAERAGTAH